MTALRLVTILLLLGVRPALGQIAVQSALAYDFDAAPGGIYEGEILVENSGDRAEEARVYARDYLFFADGSNEYGEPGSGARSNADWVSFAPDRFTVPARGSRVVQFSVRVPADLSEAIGSFWSLVMIEGLGADAPETAPSGTDTEVGFRQVTRYGVQIATHFPGGEPLPNIDAPSLTRDPDGTPVFSVDVANEGTSMFRPEVHLRLFALDGTEFGTVEGTPYRLYPGTSVRQRLELPELEPGQYQALLILDGGGEHLFGAQYDLSL